MSFSVDDPLAGILSDGSDDSFFDDDILGKKKPAKKITPAVEKKSALFDLDDKTEFKLSDITAKKKIEASEADYKVPMNTEFSEKNKPDSQQLKPSSSFKLSGNADSKRHDLSILKDLHEVTDIKKSPFKSKIGTSNEKIDILDDILGSKKINTEQTDKRKGPQSILDYILGKPSKDSSQVTKSASTKNQQYNLDNILSKNDSKETLSSKKQSKPLPVTSNENQQKKTKSSEDWLGIFEEQNDGIEDDNPDMPSWLGGSSSVKKKTQEKRTKNVTKKETEIEPELAEPAIKQSKESTGPIESTKFELKNSSDLEKNTLILPNAEVKNEEDVATQGAAVFLQQQEAQLMVALQLKAQDEKLAAMQLKQKEAQRVHREAAAAQHAQLDAMLQKQANHRLQMQAIINAHQDRIAQRIKALLDSNETGQDDDTVGDGYENSSKDNSDSPRNKEKKQLLQLIQSLQENHDKEIDLMETSYRKQLAFLEFALSQTEERMKEESDKVVNYYMEKINWLEEHHGLHKKWTEENIASLIERHNVEKEMLRQQHMENVGVLQEHHRTLMQNINNAVKQEQALMRDSAGFSTDLKDLLADVRDNKMKCDQLVDKVTTLTDKTQTEVERSLQIREIQINDMIQQLKKEREYFEKEKSETKDTIHTLEVRIKQMTTTIEEDTAVLKQKKMELEFEKATFSKQTEFAKNVLKKQDEEVKMLKEDMQKEYKEKIERIEEEKSKLLKDSSLVAKEKATVQSLRMELEKTKAELQAQIEEMSEERSKLIREKQDLHMEEQRILAKGKDLDVSMKAALEKQSQAEKKYSEAEHQQRMFEERMHKLQEHIVSLNTREKQIAREKITLSRERINLHNDWKQMEGRQQCSLCRSIPRTPQYNFDAAFSRSYDAPASRDYGEANMSHAFSAIEQEMAHLMGRSFALKHDTLIAQRPDVRDNVDSGHTETVPSEPAAFKDYMDPKFMMLRLDVQKVIHNISKEGATND